MILIYNISSLIIKKLKTTLTNDTVNISKIQLPDRESELKISSHKRLLI